MSGGVVLSSLWHGANESALPRLRSRWSPATLSLLTKISLLQTRISFLSRPFMIAISWLPLRCMHGLHRSTITCDGDGAERQSTRNRRRNLFLLAPPSLPPSLALHPRPPIISNCPFNRGPEWAEEGGERERVPAENAVWAHQETIPCI